MSWAMAKAELSTCLLCNPSQVVIETGSTPENLVVQLHCGKSLTRLSPGRESCLKSLTHQQETATALGGHSACVGLCLPLFPSHWLVFSPPGKSESLWQKCFIPGSSEVKFSITVVENLPAAAPQVSLQEQLSVSPPTRISSRLWSICKSKAIVWKYEKSQVVSGDSAKVHFNPKFLEWNISLCSTRWLNSLQWMELKKTQQCLKRFQRNWSKILILLLDLPSAKSVSFIY